MLGFWAGTGGRGESTKYWISVLTEIKTGACRTSSSSSAAGSRAYRIRRTRSSRWPRFRPASSIMPMRGLCRCGWRITCGATGCRLRGRRNPVTGSTISLSMFGEEIVMVKVLRSVVAGPLEPLLTFLAPLGVLPPGPGGGVGEDDRLLFAVVSALGACDRPDPAAVGPGIQDQAISHRPAQPAPGPAAAQLLGRLPWLAAEPLRAFFLRARFPIGVSPCSPWRLSRPAPRRRTGSSRPLSCHAARVLLTTRDWIGQLQRNGTLRRA